MSEGMQGGKQESIYHILKEEHREVQKLFKQIIDSERFQLDIFTQINQALMAHMQGEEKHFYPRLVSANESHSLALEAIEEHNAAKQIQQTIPSASDNEVQFAKTQVLSEMIDHHIEEEEKELFKAAKKVLSKDDEMEIGRLFLNEKASMSKMAAPTVM